MRLIDADALLEAIKNQPQPFLMGSLGAQVRDLITNAPTVQCEGWVSVPIEPTPEMSSYLNTGVDWKICERIYKAMIQAAPTDKE